MNINQINTLSPEDIKKAMENARSLMQFNYEFKHRKADGSIRDVEVFGSIIEIDGKEYMHSIVYDITEKKKAEKIVRESEEMLRNSQSLAHICSYSTDLTINDIAKSQWVCSPEFYNIFGIDETYPHTIDGWLGFVHPDYREEIAAYHDSVIKERKSFHREYKIIRINDGEERWVYGTGELEFDQKGNPIRMHGAIQDITEQKQAELALRESEERFRYLLRDIPTVAVQGYRFDGTTTYWNKASENLYGYTAEEAIGRNLLDLIIPVEMRENVRNDMQQMCETMKPAQASEMLLMRKDGSRVSVFSSHAIVQRHGHLPELFCLDIDITESKQAEEALRKSEAIKNKMVSNIGDVIVIIDKNAINQYKSPNIEPLFGWKPEELIGKNTFEVVHPDDVERIKKFIHDLTQEPNASGTTELRYKRKDGKYVWIEITVVNLLHDRDIKGVMGNYHDISDRKSAEKELIKAKEKAEESDRLKSAFLANMSHEIRTPMNAIMGFSSLLKEKEFKKEKQNYFLNIINSRTKDLLRIIDDVIDISKIEANQLRIEKADFSLNKVLLEIYAAIKSDLQNQNRDDVKIRINEQFLIKQLIIHSDESRLKQVLLNLMYNAVKFTENGSIEFGYSIEKDNTLQFYVKDTGVGIPPKAGKFIFERFRQADDSISRKYGGTGLGLPISKSIVELLGGKIWFESEEGKGTTFYFTVPLIKSTPENVESINDHSITQYDWSKKTVLIAEDDQASMHYLVELINPTHMIIIKAESGEKVMEVLNTNSSIDVILLDINLPDSNGNELVKAIKKKKPKMPVIAQSAYSMIEEIKTSKKAGFDDYITKPIDAKLLLSTLNKYLDRK
jgi:PAS domain S-box-containing protein